ncbi:hypothetical protein ACS0TY_029741 [Phlomoides rotata]
MFSIEVDTQYATGDEDDKRSTNHSTRIIHMEYLLSEKVIDTVERGRIILVEDAKKKVQDVVQMMEMELGEGWILNSNCKTLLSRFLCKRSKEFMYFIRWQVRAFKSSLFKHTLLI